MEQHIILSKNPPFWEVLDSGMDLRFFVNFFLEKLIGCILTVLHLVELQKVWLRNPHLVI